MSIASKNLYDLLGNDPELDPDREPEPPTKVADKPTARTGKRNAGAEGPVRDTQKPAGAARGGRTEVPSGNERAIRDKTAGADSNRSRPVEDGARQDRPSRRGEGEGGRGRGRGVGRQGRGGRGPRDDRHSRTNIGEHEKQAAHGWGAETGEAELADEKGGLSDAHAEEKQGVVTDGAVVNENGTPADELPAEPEDNSKSYEQYLAEQLEKKAALNDRQLELRKANEGSSKKFPEGKAFARDNENEDFIAGSGGKAKRERERKAKATLDIDQTWKEAPEPRDRESRGGRGGAGRGRGRGGERGEFRGRGGRGRGEGRGGGGERSAPRGNRGGPSGAAVNITDSSAFPSLGA